MWIQDTIGDWNNSDNMAWIGTRSTGRDSSRVIARFNVSEDTEANLTDPLPTAEAEDKLREIIKAIQGGQRIFSFAPDEPTQGAEE